MLMQFSPTLCFLFVLLVTPTRGEKAIGFLANEGRSSQRLSFSAGKVRRSKRCRILWLSLPPLLFLTSFRLFKFSGLFFFSFRAAHQHKGRRVEERAPRPSNPRRGTRSALGVMAAGAQEICYNPLALHARFLPPSCPFEGEQATRYFRNQTCVETPILRPTFPIYKKTSFLLVICTVMPRHFFLPPPFCARDK